MAIKIKRRDEKPEEEVSATDSEETPAVSGDLLSEVPVVGREAVFEAPRQTFGWLADNRKLVIGVVAAVVVVLVAGSLIVAQRGEKHLAMSTDLYRVLQQATAPVDEADVPAGEPAYATLNERLGAQAAEARRVAGQGNEAIAHQATLLAAAADLGLGRADEATAAYRSYRSGATNNLERTVAEIGIAASLAQAGNLAEALDVLSALEATIPAAAAAAALQRAVLIDTFGAPEQALAAWQTVARADESGAAPGTRRAGERVRQLELLLGTASAETEEGAE